MSIVDDQYAAVPVDTLASMLPSWLAVNAADTPESSIYFKILSALSAALSNVMATGQMSLSKAFLDKRSNCYPRMLWSCKCGDSFTGEVSIKAPAWESAITVRRVYTEGALLLASDPVYARSSDGRLYFRNIAQVTEVLDSSDGVYILSQKMVPDEILWAEVNSSWNNLSVLDSVVNPETGKIVISTGGLMTVKYTATQKVTELAAGPSVILGTNPAIELTCHDMWNAYDEAGILSGVGRITGEPNVSMAERIRCAYSLLQDSGAGSAGAGIGQDIGAIGLTGWDGSTTLNLSDFGRVTYAVVLDLQRVKTVSNETLLADPDKRTFASSSAEWSGWEIFVNNTRVSSLSYPNMSVTGGIVDFGESVSGVVTASYSLEMYRTSISLDDGTAVLQKTANTPPGSYTVLYLKDVETYTTADQAFLQKLLTSDGLPTDLYLAVSKAASTTCPVLVGSTSWGSQAHWFDDTESAPELTHLPVVIK